MSEPVLASGFPAGEAIVAAAALIAAALAAWTAERRLKITLAAQQEQHRAELAHDREMRDLDEMRQTLDAVSSHLALVRRSGHKFLSAAKAEDTERWKPSSAIEDTRQRFENEIAAVRESYERLVVRLGRDDGLVMCVGLIDMAVAPIAEVINELPDPETRAEALSAIDEFLAAAGYYAGVFTGIARVRFSSQFSDEDSPSQFFDSLREGLEKKDDETSLMILHAFQKLMDESDEQEGEEEGIHEASIPASSE